MRETTNNKSRTIPAAAQGSFAEMRNPGLRSYKDVETMKAQHSFRSLGSPRRTRCGTERGIALLLTLGVLSMLLMLGLSLTVGVRAERAAAAANADMVRARIIAESGLERGLAILQNEFRYNMYPGTDFYAPDSDSDWSGRLYLASINGADTNGITDALSAALNDNESLVVG